MLANADIKNKILWIPSPEASDLGTWKEVSNLCRILQ